MTVQYLRAKGTTDGNLLASISDAIDVLITVDSNMRFQQNLKKYARLSCTLIAGGDGNTKTLLPIVPLVDAALRTIKPGQWIRIP